MGFLDPNNLVLTAPNKKKKKELLLHLLAITPSTPLLPLLNLPATVNLLLAASRLSDPRFQLALSRASNRPALYRCRSGIWILWTPRWVPYTLRDTFIQASFVSFYAELGKLCDARKVFEEMSELCVVAWNAMIDGFGKNGDIGSAVLLFESMSERDMVSWTSIINGFGRNGCFSEGIQFFQMMMNHENVMGCFVESNEATYVSVLSSYANLGGWGSIYWGKQIHGHGSECQRSSCSRARRRCPVL